MDGALNLRKHFSSSFYFLPVIYKTGSTEFYSYIQRQNQLKKCSVFPPSLPTIIIRQWNMLECTDQSHYLQSTKVSMKLVQLRISQGKKISEHQGKKYQSRYFYRSTALVPLHRHSLLPPVGRKYKKNLTSSTSISIFVHDVTCTFFALNLSISSRSLARSRHDRQASTSFR